MLNTLKDADFTEKKVLLRADLDVPLDVKSGDISDDSRLKAAIPTIKKILDDGAKQLIIMGHMGSPGGKIVKPLCMDKVAIRLMKLSGKSICKLDDCINIKIPENEKIILLENLRFHKEEEANDIEFAKKLASCADIYVNNAFATCHRAHASMHAITKLLPGCIGLQIEKELENLDFSTMQRPIIALLGGAKLKTKIPIIQAMLVQADKVLIGGGMMFTFYAVQGLEIGKSLVDYTYSSNAKIMLYNEKLALPKDVVIADYENNQAGIRTVSYNQIPAKSIGLDIGEESIEEFKQELRKANTIIWNGPMGYYEKPPFDKATAELAKIIADLDCKKIVGGGDTADLINKLGLAGKFTFVSSGGGAALELLSGKKLVALEELDKNTRSGVGYG
ncbi:phosphoglycerate kinase [Candidatus Woesearchaeota archaeon]|nr:phosphoglycerate kinase [Candidatus Woesearchaeota archaeon]